MHLATLFLQQGQNTNGTVERSYPPLSALTHSRMSFEEAIESSGNPEQAIATIALQNYEPLLSYIQHMGEVAPGNPIGALIQASLLRCKEIAYIASATDSTEIEALHILEDTESGALNTGDPRRDYILPSDVQAAIKKTIEQMRRVRTDNGQSPELISIVSDCCGDCDINSFSFFDFLGNVTQGDPLYNKEYWDDQSIRRALMYPDKKNNADGNGFFDGLFAELKKVLDRVGETAQGSVDNVASNSMREAIKRNLPIIIGIIVILGLVIFLSVYYARKKS